MKIAGLGFVSLLFLIAIVMAEDLNLSDLNPSVGLDQNSDFDNNSSAKETIITDFNVLVDVNSVISDSNNSDLNDLISEIIFVSPIEFQILKGIHSIIVSLRNFEH